MRKKAYKNIIILLLIIAAIFVSSPSVFAAKPKKQKGKQGAKKTEAADQKEKAAKKVRTEIKYVGFEAKRNPFAPPKEVAMLIATSNKTDVLEKIESIKIPKIDIQGIIWSRSMPQVIVNGTVMKVGDYISEFQIKEVNRNAIILFYKGKDYLMKMQQSQNKTKKQKRKK
ncbi:MAG: general secretion pathway protein GspB [Candidatus Omnitrophica bacterium]|nr:general secretion pathway protein GspB [Candidatus Omnitrophota bacterium]